VAEKLGQPMPVVLGLLSTLAKWGIAELDASTR
jgi:DNA-binding IclR family transcriptional regulator